jgi:DNA helicase-2/ATP-dependent DNA helicase PcrA
VAEGGHQTLGHAAQSTFANDFNASTYSSPGWKRAQTNRQNYEAQSAGNSAGNRRSSGGRRESAARMSSSAYKRGERIFHQKFGYGRIDIIDGNKLTVHFEKAGTKKVLDSYVEKH